MSIERRQHQRIHVDWPARAGRKGLGIAPGRVKDASIAGIFIETSLTVSMGDQVLIEIQIDANEKPVLAQGKIMRTQSIRNGHFGYGIQFTRIDDESLQRLLAVLAKKATAAS